MKRTFLLLMFCAFPVFAQMGFHQPRIPNLVVYWPLNEGAGSIAGDATMNGYTATLIASPVWTNAVVGKGLAFNGTSQYGDAGSANYFQSLQHASICGWFWRGAIGQTTGAGFYSAVNTNGFVIDWFSDDNIYAIIGNGSVSYGVFAEAKSGWHHIVFTYDGTQAGNAKIVLYFDGAIVSASSYSGTIPSSLSASITNHFLIGADNGGSGGAFRYWNGAADDVRVYTNTLSSQQVSALYNGGSGSPTQ